MRFIHEPPGSSESPFGAAWTDFRSRLSGPIGCLVALVCLPFALIALLVMVIVAMFRVRKVHNAFRDQVTAAKAAGDAIPVATFVRTFAIDPSFTREEAVQAAVPAEGGRTAADLLDDAIARGWVVERRGALAVTDRGRAESDAVLRSRGL